ncbi:tetratricopeptide repeat protein [Myxococcota bacterium]|nr:tetratricopeptide repeat protein [Myxococcota bacterium]MBU1429956.1 tetratricopeptide repeat protein [Myxococcota bacterium]MBU1896825.1 tetratricopeptide repeat protein [Myxococcota bacterium]
MITGILLALILSAPLGSAQEKAKVAYAEGISAFKAKEYKAALDKLEYAYMLDPSPNLLFNLGRVCEEMGDFDKAIHYFQLYLDRHPDAEDADEVRGQIKGIQTVQKFRDEQKAAAEKAAAEKAAAEKAAAEKAAAEKAAAEKAAASQPASRPASAPTSQPTQGEAGRPMRLGGWASIGLAGALALGAVALDLHTSGLIDDYKVAAAASDRARYYDLRDEIDAKNTWTLTLYGAALIAGGVGGALLYLDHQAQQAPVGVSLAPTGFVLYGAF